ncbi:MAG: hypothetical protein QT08_C0011G0005 [archaeon GW2011_AR17]|nr:MAG: hypothetical protein QT08_C0011G0005 [archaeon GW2011_AR17]
MQSLQEKQMDAEQKFKEFFRQTKYSLLVY